MNLFIYLYKICSVFFLPVGFTCLSLLILWWLIRKQTKLWLKCSFIVIIIGLCISSSVLGSYLFVRPLEKRAVETTTQSIDAIIVLSGGAPIGIDRKMALGPATLQRLNKGYQLHQETNVPIIVTGKVFYEETSMAETMKQTLISWGVNQDKIIVEDLAVNTWQNAVYSLEKMEGMSVNKVAIVTSATHMVRSIECFKAADKENQYDFYKFPCDFTYQPEQLKSFLYWLPSAGALNDVNRALHEYIGIVWYRLAYW